jgi:hypothetical protein
MAQVAFFVGGLSVGFGGAGALLAWDRHDLGPGAADDLNPQGVGLYSWLAPITGAQLIRIKTKSPVKIPEENCPETPDGFPSDFFDRLEVKPGGTAFTPIVDFTFDIFEGSTLIYGVAPAGQTLKIELADGSVAGGGFAIQDRPTLQPWEDSLEGLTSVINFQQPSKELWRALMTPNQPIPGVFDVF